MSRILITGGAGFVGSRLALNFRESQPADEIVVLDNLKRRGSEINLPVFKKHGVTFVHGDVRNPEDLNGLSGNFDTIIEASAEPSVMAGITDSPSYVIDTNLTGAIHCLEFARKRAKNFVFLSTSRVYSIESLRKLPLEEKDTRLELVKGKAFPGTSNRGISELFSTQDTRSFYGTSKLAAELVAQEYFENFGLRGFINRCGVICGPGQFGKVDQGVFTFWLASHFFGVPLSYKGFGGKGKQVRDVLHPDDLFDLIVRQTDSTAKPKNEVYNVGGGASNSISLCELTKVCQELVGRPVPIKAEVETNSVDVPYYVSDFSLAHERFDWSPKKNLKSIFKETLDWIRGSEEKLKTVFVTKEVSCSP